MQRFFSQRLIVLLALLLLVATGCVGTRLGVSWAALETVGDEQNILIAYNDYLALVDPREGVEVPLRNSEGEIRFDNESGEPRRWEVLGGEFQAQFFSSPIFINDEELLVADYNRRLFTVDFPTAQIQNTGITTDELGQILTDLSDDGERVFLPYNQSNLAARDLETFDPEWEFETGNAVWAAPLLLDGTLYFTSMDHFLYAVEAETGEEVWRVDLEGAAAATPTLYNGRLFVGSFARKVFEVSLQGEILNTQETNNWVWSAPAIDENEGTMYVTDLDGYVYAMDPNNGLAPIWEVRAAETGIRPSALIAGNYVIVGARNGNVVWLDRESGEPQFTRELGAEILSELMLIEPSETLDISQPLVILSTVAADRTLVAYDLENANQQWVYGR